MKRIVLSTVAGIGLLITSAFAVQAIINWQILNDKTQVKFMMEAHGQDLVGSFTGVKGDIQFDPTDLTTSSFKCSIDVATINTGMEQRNQHLQAKGWFDAVANPTINFTSEKIVPATQGGYFADGKITMKGVTKDARIAFTFDAAGSEEGVFKGSFDVKRSDFGVGKTDGDISDVVKIALEVPVKKK